MLPHQTYSPHIAPSDFHLIGPLTYGLLGHHYYKGDEALLNALTEWLQKKENKLYWMERSLLIESKLKNNDSVEITNKMPPCIRIYYSTVH